MSNGSDIPPIVPDIPAVDQGVRSALTAAGMKKSGIAEYTWGALWASVVDGLKAIMTLLADAFDEIISIILPFLTASQGTNTKGFYDLVSAVMNDLLGIEVAGDELAQAANDRGIIGGMQKAGEDFYNVLLNEFLGNDPQAGPGAGVAGLPGVPGTPLTPEQGVKGAQAFMGFILSFAVRQGNLAVLTDALSFHLLGQMREYGELMAKNLGLGRLSRRILQPIVQTTISTPLQQALNVQYRPHVMDSKQIAGAFIRGEIDTTEFAARMALQGFSDADIKLLQEDTYTRLPLEDVYLLHENGIFGDQDFAQRVSFLGYSPADVGFLIQAKNLAQVQRVDRQYVSEATRDLQDGKIDLNTFIADVDSTTLPLVEKAALKRNASNRVLGHRKQLSLGFLKRAFIDGQITIDELLTHAKTLGYDQDDVDIIEVEVLSQFAAHKAAAAAKAAKIAGKSTPKKTSGTPPAAPAV